jgi:hypothetical protein
LRNKVFHTFTELTEYNQLTKIASIQSWFIYIIKITTAIDVTPADRVKLQQISAHPFSVGIGSLARAGDSQLQFFLEASR